MKNDQLAQKIKTLRKAKGLSQEALAEKAGLSLRTVQRIEIKNKNPSGETLKRLSAALEVSPNDLMDWEPNENPTYLILMAISPILFVFNSFLAIIVPLILWLIKKNSIKGVKKLGIKILTIEIIWLVVYFIFRTLNFLRLNYKMGEVISLNDSQMESMISDFSSQLYLKIFFIIVNVIIILVFTYKTFKTNNVRYSNLTA